MRTRRLQLDFAPRARRGSRVGLAVLAAGLAGFGIAAFEVAQLVNTNSRQADLLAALDARTGRGTATRAPARTPPADPAESARARSVRLVAQNLVTPWADLLESLETKSNRAVALLSVEPSVAKKSIRLTAEAKNAQDMVAYLEALQADARLQSVVLVSHQVQLQVPGTPVRFQVQAGWGTAP